MRACWLKWVGRDWSISADYIWLNYSGANNANAEFIDALIRLLLEPVIFPFTLFLIIAAIAIIIAILNILLGG